jgi:hypothetical protein
MSEHDRDARVVQIGRAPDGLVTFGNPVAATDRSGHTLSILVDAAVAGLRRLLG